MTEGPFFVTFTVARQPMRRPTPDHERWTLEDLKDGFWITQDHFLCRETQGHYWVPPSQITLIEKRHEQPSPL